MTATATMCPLCSSIRCLPASLALLLSKCPDCGLRFRDPQPKHEDLRAIYRQAYTEEVVATGSLDMAGTGDDIARQYVQQLQQFETLAGRRIFDFGAGLGSMSRALQAAGAAVTAVDPYSAAELRRQGLQAHESLDDPGLSEPFDGCSAIEVLEHLREPWTVMAHLAARLKPGGFLILTTPNVEGLKPRLRLDRWSESIDQAHLMLFQPRSIETALRRAGFTRWRRLHKPIRFSNSAGANWARALLQRTGLDGQLRYIAWT